MIRDQTRIRLPRLISDGMVIQRNARVNLWGSAPAGEAITVRFLNRAYSAAADADGEWLVELETEDAGGPYELVIENGDGTDSITIANVLLGDVWVCSGQSNMGMTMFSVKDRYPEEIAKADHDAIRQFQVPVTYNFEKPQADFESGCWEAANPERVLKFTAAGYFFALALFERYRVPIGLIHASLGGAPAESFLSEEALIPFTEYYEAALKLKDKDCLEALVRQDQAISEAWHHQVDAHDQGMQPGGKPYYAPDCDASDWPVIQVPSYWEEEGLGHFHGAVWFRKEVEIPRTLAGEPAKLLLGHIVDEDTVYLNGRMLGTRPNQYVPSNYEIPEGHLREGANTIVVRVVNLSGKGGFYPGKPYQLQIGDQVIGLSGEWQVQIGARSGPLPAPANVQWRPLGLFNGMIAPLVRYSIRGVVWYQGESNAKKPETYESLFKALIADWRKQWGVGDFPFLYVQLPNYMEPSDRPASGNWALIREAQRRTLAVPGTGMAVTLDIGEWNDVHPTNKQDVGRRLALAARSVAYGDEDVVASGPMFRAAARDGNRIVLSFSDTGGGLAVRGGQRLRHFAIAGADGKFVWANAELRGDQVVVWHDRVPDPLYVRYAWADNPEGANLYNREGLPASPFTTE